VSAHTPYVEDVMNTDCVYGEHEHDESDDCPITRMTVCRGCADEAVEDADGLIYLTPWPCPSASAEKCPRKEWCTKRAGHQGACYPFHRPASASSSPGEDDA
jgi:hypothetical protein